MTRFVFFALFLLANNSFADEDENVLFQGFENVSVIPKFESNRITLSGRYKPNLDSEGPICEFSGELTLESKESHVDEQGTILQMECENPDSGNLYELKGLFQPFQDESEGDADDKIYNFRVIVRSNESHFYIITIRKKLASPKLSRNSSDCPVNLQG